MRFFLLKIFSIIVFLVFIPYQLHVVDIDVPTEHLLVNLDDNVIRNTRADMLRDKSLVSIIHMGDSHVQAGIISSTLKKNIADRYGVAKMSPGLLFPYSILGSNNPVDYVSYHSGIWRFQKVNGAKTKIPSGLFGAYVVTSDSGATISFKLKQRNGIQPSFNRIGVFYKTMLNEVPVVLTPQAIEVQRSEGYVEYAVNSEDDSLTIGFRNELNGEIIIQAVNLWHTHTPFSVSSTGLNGAAFSGYNKSIFIEEELKLLNPNCIIVSFGTNDSYTNVFDSTRFKRELKQFIEKVKTACPNSLVILTTPNDHLFEKAASNPNALMVSSMIKDFAEQRNLPYWDFYTIMGGYSSISSWMDLGFAAPDGIHFKPKGYELQANLLFDAMLKTNIFEYFNPNGPAN
ncbi:GDSL-type esterase/lipase family protein [Tenuifilum thalassicum]|uniref:SGNH hydrolase-type esterase domain-containing protein n=1 Tax=Tenuifilum thalassicum TaxID=2590900 RepID=A0A7D4BFX3_9BACT|nr:GDSL-type esterase/lipase family protein [Tenuifilum thalassicum]QKG80918.1 hypothetical protein FHG85_11815 [Tenuifilum thalassicum]